MIGLKFDFFTEPELRYLGIQILIPNPNMCTLLLMTDCTLLAGGLTQCCCMLLLLLPQCHTTQH